MSLLELDDLTESIKGNKDDLSWVKIGWIDPYWRMVTKEMNLKRKAQVKMPLFDKIRRVREIKNGIQQVKPRMRSYCLLYMITNCDSRCHITKEDDLFCVSLLRYISSVRQ